MENGFKARSEAAMRRRVRAFMDQDDRRRGVDGGHRRASDAYVNIIDGWP